jgi:hypothetical protein
MGIGEEQTVTEIQQSKLFTVGKSRVGDTSYLLPEILPLAGERGFTEFTYSISS